MPFNTTIVRHEYRFTSKPLTDEGDFPDISTETWSTLPLSDTTCHIDGVQATGAGCANTGTTGNWYRTDIATGLTNGRRYLFEVRYVTNAGTNNVSDAVRFVRGLPNNPGAVVDLRNSDPEFVRRIRDILGIAEPTSITRRDMARVLWVNWRDRDAILPPRITNLNGLEHAVNLRAINITHHHVTTIRQLTNLVDVAGFAFQGSLLADASPLRKMVNMETLYMNAGGRNSPPGFDQSTAVRDFSRLNRLTKLKTLFICDNKVDPQQLAPFVNLETLSLCRNDVTSVSPLRHLTKLKTLYLFENFIWDASPLAALRDMELLHLHGNRLRDAAFLANMTKAKQLSLSDNPFGAGNVVETLTPLLRGQCSIPTHTTETDCTGATGTWTEGALKLVDLRGDTQVTDQDVNALRAIASSTAAAVLWDGEIRPARPSDFSAAQAGTGRVALVWSNPHDDDILAYQYRHRSGDGDWSDWRNSMGAGSSFHDWTHDRADRTALTVQGLADGTYDFELRALVGSDYNNRRTRDATGAMSNTIKILQTTVRAAGVGSFWDVGRVLTPGPSARFESVVLTTTAPRAVQPPSNLRLDVTGRSEVDLQAVFEDADGDALTFTAETSGQTVASVRIVGTRLLITGNTAGTTVISVEASDGTGRSARVRFTVHVGIVLSLAGDVTALEGGTARLRVELTNAVNTATTFRWRVLADDDPETADADADDHGDASGEGSVAAGQTWTEIEVPLADDGVIEPAREWFAVEIELSGEQGAALGRQQARVEVLEGVCDRSPTMRDVLSRGQSCEAPTPERLASLRSLVAVGRDIDSLFAGDLLGLSGLRTLDLRGNALETLPEGLLAHAPQLRVLRLGRNRLTALSADLSGLVDLDLSDNALTTLPPAQFANMTTLRRLRLDGNALNVLPDNLFAGVESLRSLRLDRNPGSPFALPLTLRRTDAERWAPGPATVQVAIPTGAPFAFEAKLSAVGGILRMEDAPVASVAIPAGGTAGAALWAERSAESRALRIELTAPVLPATICDGVPCWQGFELAAGEPLLLFSPPPTAGETPLPEALYGEALRLPLVSLATSGDGSELRWTVRSSDESVATVYIEGDELIVEPAYTAEGSVQIDAVATDAFGQSAMVTFDVHVEFFWPMRTTAGWRVVHALPPE